MARKTKTEQQGYSIVDGFLCFYLDGALCPIGSHECNTILDSPSVTSIRVVNFDDRQTYYDWVEGVGFKEFPLTQELTLRKDVRGGKPYWYAYRRRGRLIKRYVGYSHDVTVDRLYEIVKKLPR